MSFDLYQEAILEELKNPQNKQPMADPDLSVSETNASCGDDVTVYIKLDRSGEKIANLTWQGQGCAISQAAVSLLSEHVRGLSWEAVLELDQSDMEQLLGLEEPIAYGRVKCLLLGLNAIQKAVRAQ